MTDPGDIPASPGALTLTMKAVGSHSLNVYSHQDGSSCVEDGLEGET